MNTVFLAIGCAGAWPPPSVPSLDDPVRASVPIRSERNLVLLPVSVAGSAPFELVLDTGMPTPGIVLYDSAKVEALHLEFEASDTLSGAGGSGASIRTRIAGGAKIEIGGLALSDVPVISLPLPPGFPTEHEGIIGSELFEKFAVRIDRDASRLELLDSATLAPGKGASIVPLHFRGGGPFLDAEVAVGEGEPIPAELAIDLGAGHALWLNAGREARFGPPQGAIETTLGRGLSGALEGRVGRVRRLEVGDFAFESVVAIFPAASQQHPGGVDFRDGFIGGETLSRFRVTFDYAGKRMILEPGRRFREPFEHDMTGLVLDPVRDGRRVVRFVVADSPAARAEILPGDVLVAIDGKSVGELEPEAVLRAFRVENAELRLTLERGSSALEKRIRLRRLV